MKVNTSRVPLTTTTYSDMSFRSIAERYNVINSIPPQAQEQIGSAIVALAAGHGRILDMGCGAGRIALPVARAGGRVVGIDLERAMLLQAAAATGETIQAAFVHGDITRLPLASAIFGVVLSINVLHLVPAWQNVLAEAVRVLQPGGLFIQGRDWLDPDSCAGILRAKLRETVMALAPGLRPTAAASPAVMANALTALGGSHDAEQIAARWAVDISPAALVDQMEQRAHNETWMLDEGLLREAVKQLRHWIAVEWDDPAQPLPVERRFVLTVTRGLA